MVSADGTSPLPSPAGVVHTPDAAPVGSGQVGFDSSAFVLQKYAGNEGASSAGAGAGADAMPTAAIDAIMNVRNNLLIKPSLQMAPSIE